VRNLRDRGLSNRRLECLFNIFTIIARGLTLPALGLAIVGSAKLGARPTDAQIDASYDFRKATATILLVAYLFYVKLAITLCVRRRETGIYDTTVFYHSIATLPFFLVIVVYQLLFAFDRKSNIFLPWTLKPWAEAFMSTTMEIIVVILLVVGGLRCTVWRSSLSDRSYDANISKDPMFSGNGAGVFQPNTVEKPSEVPEIEPVSPRTQEPPSV
jgi:hypothetical protein